jgi:radical SAM/Cys-rich protein
MAIEPTQDARSTSGPDVSNHGAQDFNKALQRHGLGEALNRAQVHTLQINVGKRCNQACHHCHVDAGPKRTEQMTRATAERLITLLEASPEVAVVDITGGAPELNPQFRYLVEAARSLNRHVIDRCNLTILLEPEQHDLAGFLARNQVEIIASLPCYSASNVDAQRGRGVFGRSITALQALNALGYGQTGSDLLLNLVYNPGGTALPPEQGALQADYKARLAEDFGIVFNKLYTLSNMPIARFRNALERAGTYEDYMQRLVDSFNPSTVPHLMCRDQVSVSWDGQLHDCDFNQMLMMPLGGGCKGAVPQTLWDLSSFRALSRTPIATDAHCFGCTAGSGSSCGGALQ